MNRLFGRAKPKQPPPNLTDCIANVRKFVSNCFKAADRSWSDDTMLLQYDGIRQHFRFKAHFNNYDTVVELQFKDLNYFFVYTGLTDFDVRAIDKYSPQPVLERLISYSETIHCVYFTQKCLK